MIFDGKFSLSTVPDIFCNYLLSSIKIMAIKMYKNGKFGKIF